MTRLSATDHSPIRRAAASLLAGWRGVAARAVLTIATLAACASTGATFRSGVGDAYLEHPPYYAGEPGRAAVSEGTRLGHLPIAYQRGAAQAPIFDPASSGGTPVSALLAEMNAYLDSLAAAGALSVRIADAGRASNAANAGTASPPDVRFGCPTSMGAPGEECEDRDRGGVLGRAGQRMHLAVGRPSRAWVDWLRDVTTDAGVSRTLVLTLEVGQYLPRQEGWRGDKAIELGTGHVARLPWLTSVETPVAVLQLTGAVVDRDGRALRIGAEGIVARRNRLLVSAVGAQELLTDEDVAAARVLRRDDLPGRPLAWRVALTNLVAGLTGRDDLGRVAAR